MTQYCHRMITSEEDYEACLEWLATVSIFANKEETKIHSSALKQTRINQERFNKIHRSIEECSLALGSQSKRWRDASAKLSSCSIEFATFEFKQAIYRQILPKMTEELHLEVISLFGPDLPFGPRRIDEKTQCRMDDTTSESPK